MPRARTDAPGPPPPRLRYHVLVELLEPGQSEVVIDEIVDGYILGLGRFLPEDEGWLTEVSRAGTPTLLRYLSRALREAIPVLLREIKRAPRCFKWVGRS